MGGAQSVSQGEVQVNPGLLGTLLNVNDKFEDESNWDYVRTLIFQLAKIEPSSEEIFAKLTPTYIKHLKVNHPKSLATVVTATADYLIQLSHNRNVLIIKGNPASACLRLLTRLVPLLFETPEDGIAQKIFWDVPEPQKSEEAPEEEIKVESEEPKVFEPLAIRLMKALQSLMFFQGITIASSNAPQTKQTGEVLPLNNVWFSGIGVQVVLASEQEHLLARTEILRCLLALFSECLYNPIDGFISPTNNQWLNFFVQHSSYYSKGLFYSLINTLITYDPYGWGVPYNHLIFSDYHEELLDVSLQVLTLLLNYDFDTIVKSAIIPGSHETIPQNIYINYLKSVKRKEEFGLLVTALAKVIHNPLIANATYLPNSTKSLSCNQEAVILLWRIVLENDEFIEYLCLSDEFANIILPLLLYVSDCRRNPTLLGVVHLTSFVFLVLSGHRHFGVALNRPVTQKLSIDSTAFQGSFGDLIIQIFTRVVEEKNPRMEPFLNCLLTVLANISPYLKTITMETSYRAIRIFKILAKPQFLAQKDSNYRLLFLILDFINNIVQYQYEGNSKLFYCILVHQDLFKQLALINMNTLKKKPKVTPPSTEQSQSNLIIQDKPEEIKEKDEEPNKEVPPTIETETLQEAGSTFIPTPEWLESWRPHMPLGAILQLIDALLPQIQALVTGNATDEAQILDFLNRTTLVGLLPPPAPILIRKYQKNLATDIWFLCFLWGVIYKRNIQPAIFSGSRVKLFTVHIRE